MSYTSKRDQNESYWPLAGSNVQNSVNVTAGLIPYVASVIFFLWACTIQIKGQRSHSVQQAGHETWQCFVQLVPLTVMKLSFYIQYKITGHSTTKSFIVSFKLFLISSTCREKMFKKVCSFKSKKYYYQLPERRKEHSGREEKATWNSHSRIKDKYFRFLQPENATRNSYSRMNKKYLRFLKPEKATTNNYSRMNDKYLRFLQPKICENATRNIYSRICFHAIKNFMICLKKQNGLETISSKSPKLIQMTSKLSWQLHKCLHKLCG